MTTAPLVSVVIPCYNQARYLAGALSSVHQQHWPALESIVVDDGSTDDTSYVAKNLGASVVRRQRNRGLSRARNVGLDIARGDYVIFLDADDELLPHAVEGGLAGFERRPYVDCVAGRCRLMDIEGRPLPATYPTLATDDLYAELLKTNFIWTPGAAMFRADAIRGIGGFPVTHPAAADYAVMLAFARGGRLSMEPRDTVRYRKHDANMSSNPMLMLRGVLWVLEQERLHALEQHRGALAEGRRRWRTFYGEQVNMQLRREWRGERRAAQLIKAAMFYCRYCPRDAATHFWRKLTRIARQIPPSDLDQHDGKRTQPSL